MYSSGNTEYMCSRVFERREIIACIFELFRVDAITIPLFVATIFYPELHFSSLTVVIDSFAVIVLPRILHLIAIYSIA